MSNATETVLESFVKNRNFSCLQKKASSATGREGRAREN